jgi:hypothetical protein
MKVLFDKDCSGLLNLDMQRRHRKEKLISRLCEKFFPVEGIGREAVNGLERSLLTGYDASVGKCEQAAILSQSV